MKETVEITRRTFTSQLAATGLLFTLPSQTQSLISTDAPAVPIQPSGITYLLGYGSRITPSLVVKRVPGRQGGKKFWVEGWNDPQQSFEWTVSAKRSGRYEVTLMVSAPAGTGTVM